MLRMSGTLTPLSWFYARTLHHIDRAVYRASRGQATFTSWVSGLPIVMLTTTGAKTGRTRTLPVLGVPNEDNLVVIASNYGQDRNPAWYHNLRAQPRASIIFQGERREVVARELSGEERERWFALGVEIYPGWTHYSRRASQRQIPVLELRPVA
jgi:deazaflavin-dependent oxidoreductase (nitroreductase family)